MRDGPAVLRAFARLKVRLLRNGFRRSAESPWALFGAIVSMVAAVVAVLGAVGFAVLGRRWLAPADRELVAILATSGLVLGWWFGPLVSGGVDETVDPMRLVLLPLGRRDLWLGQVVAGFIGPAPVVVASWIAAIVAVQAGSLGSAVAAVPAALTALGVAMLGSRALAATLALMSRSRRGADVAALIAVVGAAAVFAAVQMARLVTRSTLDSAADVLAWTPPGAAGAAIVAAARREWGDAALRLGALWVFIAAAGAVWSRQLRRLMSTSDRSSGVVGAPGAGESALFGGWRRLLPRSPGGAAVAKELVYLRRSPGRRGSLLAGTVLGLAYVAVIVTQLDLGVPAALAAPVATLFTLQYSSNQLGVDPAAFWIEVVVGPEPSARFAGRQVLAIAVVGQPMLVTAGLLVAVDGSLRSLVVVLAVIPPTTLAVAGAGSAVSRWFVTPVPDSGNPFANRQAMKGAGVLTALGATVYLAGVAAVIAPLEWGLWWASDGRWGWFAVIAAAAWIVDWLIWRIGTRIARAQIGAVELSVLSRLDQRVNV